MELYYLNLVWKKLPEKWKELFLKQHDLLKNIDQALLKKEENGEIIFPEKSLIFNAFNFIESPEKVKVLILGQDPYHQKGQAEGLAFSAPNLIKTPPSLKNILKEYQNDLNFSYPKHHSLIHWAKQNILLLNSVLTVQENKAGSHKHLNWERFTDFIIQEVNEKSTHCVFILWGNWAFKKKILINEEKHLILSAQHPSPLSAYRGFFNSKPFSKTNLWLKNHQEETINWCLEKALFDETI